MGFLSLHAIPRKGQSDLYTREAFETYLQHLRPGGILAATRWVRMPPRDELKLFATAVAALERMGSKPAERLVLIRSWATVTLLVKNEPFRTRELSTLRRWAEDRLFDTSYLPGIEANQQNPSMCWNATTIPRLSARS